ncbi:MAG TPA: Rieske (2Fe-2S) protein [Pseudonocardiaceae bacterium]|jgi:Rieske Fe-S protein|nr:Rieske (2Fe-2S) protein [Pseudonocardiaceae bacterium]
MSRIGRFVEKVSRQRFVERVLRQRRIGRARIDPESDAELRTAILLRSARLGAGSVREEFVTSLHQRLSSEFAADPAPPAPATTRRRRFVQLAATAAAALGVGVGLDHVLTGAATAASPVNQSDLEPDHATWRTVAVSTDLPEGGVVRFDTGTVVGFIRRTNGKVAAVSGICTHLGCKLSLNRPADQLDCPCHGASFALTGAVVQHRLPIPLAPLPDIAVRETGGVVQVFTPNA